MPHANTNDQLVEQPVIGLFAELGWAAAGPPSNAGVAGESRDAGLLGRETKGEVVLAKTRLSDFEKDLADGRLVPEPPRVQSEQLTKLSPRLRQVLELLAAGWSLKEVAARLGISPKTAEVHRAKLLRCLGVKSIVEAIRMHFSASDTTSRPGTR